MEIKRYLIGLTIVAALVGCSHGGGTSIPSVQSGSSNTGSGGTSTATSAQRMTLTVHVPANLGTLSSQTRTPKYVSPSTLGATITVYGSLATPPPSPTVVADLSASSPLCTPNPDGSRNCSVQVQAPVGNDDFIVNLYDQAPVNGAISQGANLLSTSTLQYYIQAAQVNTLPLTLGGVPAAIVLGPPGFLVPPNQTSTFTFTVNAKDADGNYIVGPGNYTQPIALTITGDPNHTLTLSTTNITSPATSSVTATYNGGALPGTATITGSATGATSGSLTVQASSSVTGVTIVVPPSAQIASISLSLANPYLPTGVAGNTALTVTAKDAGGNPISGQFANAIALSSSNGSVTLSPSSITNGSTPVTANFTGTARTAITITATLAGGGVTGTTTLTPSTNVVTYPIPNPTAQPLEILQGPDGAIYFGELGPEIWTQPGYIGAGVRQSTIGRLDPTSGSISELPLGATMFEPIGLTFGSDGALWVANILSNTVSRISPFSSSGITDVAMPAAGATPNPTPPTDLGPRPRGLAQLGSTMYVTESGSFHGVAMIDMSSYAVSTFALPNSPNAPFPNGVVVGSDGNLWVTDVRNNGVWRVLPGGGSPTFFPSNVANGAARWIAAGTDGNLYMTGFFGWYEGLPGGYLVRYTTGGSATQIPLPPGSQPEYIEPGPSGTLYFSDLVWGGIGSVTTSGSVQVWPLAQATDDPYDGAGAVGYASDGSIYFTMVFPNNLSYYTPAQPFGTPIASNQLNAIGRLILAQGWTLYPKGQIGVNGLGSANAQLIGIAESGDSSPFTATTNNTAIATVSAMPGFTHNFLLAGVSPGVCLLTVTDKNGRSYSTQVNVTQTTGTVQSVRRRAGGATL